MDIIPFMNSFDKLASVYNLIRGNTKGEYKLIKRSIQLRKNQRVLDVGGGTGLIAAQLANEVKEVVVLDVSKKMLDKIKDTRIKKKIGFAQRIPFKKEDFDLVCLVDAFHHFTNGHPKEEWKEQLEICSKEILRVLKKDGQLVIVEFNPQTFIGGLIQFLENKIMHFGSQFYQPNQLRELFESNCNLEIFNSKSYCYALKITKK